MGFAVGSFCVGAAGADSAGYQQGLQRRLRPTGLPVRLQRTAQRVRDAELRLGGSDADGDPRATAQGETVDAIVDSFVARYGKKVLSAPTMKGFDIAAWIMPILILCLGILVVGWIVVHMVRPTEPSQKPSAAVDPRVERELRDFDEES